MLDVALTNPIVGRDTIYMNYAENTLALGLLVRKVSELDGA